MAGLVESQNTLVTLSTETRGAVLLDDNDFSKLLRQAVEESSHYYLLGYYVPETPTDGRFRRVEVRTLVHYGEVISRPGYYAEKPYRALSQSEREYKFLQAVVDDLPAADLPLTISSEYFPDLQNQYQVAVLLGFDYSQLSLLSGEEDLNLEIVILARDWGNRARAAVRDNLEIRSKEQTDDARFVYENLLVLVPGEYRIAAYIRDNRTGKMSKILHAIALPPEAPVQTSSLVLAGKWEETGSQKSYRIKSGKQLSILEDPLKVAGRSLVPRIDGTFALGETVYVHGKVNVRNQNLKFQYRVVLSNGDNQRLFEGSWKALNGKSGQLAEISARLPLNQLAPGRYRISAELQESGNIISELSRDFTILPAL